MIYDENIKELLDKIQIQVRNNWNKLDDMREYIECVVDYFKIRK